MWDSGELWILTSVFGSSGGRADLEPLISELTFKFVRGPPLVLETGPLTDGFTERFERGPL
jgi:hypothetical protein